MECENKVEQTMNEIISTVKNKDYESKFTYGQQEDGTLYWKIEQKYYKEEE